MTVKIEVYECRQINTQIFYKRVYLQPCEIRMDRQVAGESRENSGERMRDRVQVI